MDVDGLLTDLFDRVHELVPGAVEGLDTDQLATRPGPHANPVGWLVWHLTRITDDHVAGAFGTAQLWDEGWRERFGLPLPADDTGYGHDDDDVARVRVTAQLLTGYHQAVHARLRELLAGVDAAALDRVVDEHWDPPVTLGVRLVSVASDCLQHLGQAAYARGLDPR